MIQENLTVPRTKLSEAVFDKLLELLRSEQLKAGDRLPPERNLAERFGVSRVSLRDAIKRLELLGYVEVRQGDGSFIRRPDGKALSQPFQGLLSGQPHLARDLMEFRTLLEPQIAALAAQRCTPQAAQEFNHLLERQHRLVEDGKRLSAEDVDFHELVARVAGNLTVLHVIGTLQHLLQNLRDQSLIAGRPGLAIEQHSSIAEAIMTGQPERARDAMLEHLGSVNESIKEGT